MATLQRLSFISIAWLAAASSGFAANPVMESYTTARRITTSSSSLTINKPTGVASGDVLILLVNVTDGFTPSCTGFTAITNRSSGGVARQYAFYKVAGGSEGSTYSVAPGGTSDWLQAAMIRVSGAASPASNAIEFSSSAVSANPSVSPTVTPSDNESLVIRSAITGRTNGTLTATPSTQIFIDSVNGELPHMAASWQNCDASASGTANFTQPNARDCALITLALAPSTNIINPLSASIPGSGLDPLNRGPL